MKVICIKHPHHDGRRTPVLNCNACCSIFIAMVRDRARRESLGLEASPPVR